MQMQEEARTIRWKWMRVGHQVHVRIVVAARPEGIGVECGTLTIPERDWWDLVAQPVTQSASRRAVG